MARKHLDLKADVTFKKVFGEHERLMISFLNALLPFKMVPDNPNKKNSIV